MRFTLNLLVLLMLAGILGGVVFNGRRTRTEDRLLTQTRASVRLFQQQVHLRAALGDGREEGRGFPPSIDPAWFGDELPTNPLLPGGHPWVEVASAADKDRRHPADPVVHDETVAAFWYNPGMGIVRARVPQGISDARAIELYNYVNECTLADLFEQQ